MHSSLLVVIRAYAAMTGESGAATHGFNKANSPQIHVIVFLKPRAALSVTLPSSEMEPKQIGENLC
jgi:hypothetical protein